MTEEQKQTLREINRRFDVAEVEFPNIHFGLGHVVISDWNLGDEHIRLVLQKCDNLITLETAKPLSDAAEVVKTKELMEWLLTIPERLRVPPGEDDCLCPDCRPEIYAE